jgi:hypothetical protein
LLCELVYFGDLFMSFVCREISHTFFFSDC